MAVALFDYQKKRQKGWICVARRWFRRWQRNLPHTALHTHCNFVSCIHATLFLFSHSIALSLLLLISVEMVGSI